MSTRPSILFLGTPEFALASLVALFDAGFPIVGVVTQPDKPAARGQKIHPPPVARFAKEKSLTLFQPEKIRDESVLTALQALKPDFIVVAAYGKILPERLLKMARIECLNVHASILPEYRGAAPINQAILDDKKATGVSIMRVVKELDAGPVFLIQEIPIGDDDDAITLTHKLADVGAKVLVEAIERIASGKLVAKAQDQTKVTHVSKITKEQALIDFTKSARQIFNQVRALLPWPVANTLINGKRLKVYKTVALTTDSKKTPGEIIHLGQAGITVATTDHDLLITEVQLEGKKRMNAFDLANGLRLCVGSRFL